MIGPIGGLVDPPFIRFVNVKVPQRELVSSHAASSAGRVISFSHFPLNQSPPLTWGKLSQTELPLSVFSECQQGTPIKCTPIVGHVSTTSFCHKMGMPQVIVIAILIVLMSKMKMSYESIV